MRARLLPTSTFTWVIAASALLLSACGGSGDSNTGDQTSQPSPATPLAAAMQTGDVRQLPDVAELPKLIQQQISQRDARQNALLQQVWAGQGLVYDPGRNSQLINPQPSQEAAQLFPLLLGNAGQTLAAAGTVGKSRVAATGSNLLANIQAGNAPTMLEPARRLLTWLLTGGQGDATAPRRITLLRYKSSEQESLRAWFKAQFPAWTVTVCADDAQLASCSQGSQLLLLGSEGGTLKDDNAALTAILQQALANGVPTLYQHTAGWGEGGLPQIAGLLGFEPLPYAGNYFSQDKVNWANLAELQAQQGAKLYPQQAIARLVSHLAAGDYVFDWKQCADDEGSCAAATGIDSEFYAGARQIKNWIAALEQNNQPVFAADSPVLLKQLVLLADHYRRSVHYPMSKTNTPTADFMRALYADHALATLRSSTPALDLTGSSFSPVIGNDVAGGGASRSLTPRTVDFSSSAAVYALPGRSFTVRRLDAGSQRAWVFVNYLRSGAAHVFGEQYNRPMHLSGNLLPLRAGQTLTITHPYGGVVYVRLEHGDPAISVQLQFSGVAQQAAYTGPDSVNTFAGAVQSSPLGWSEILTPGFEVHSTTAKMRKTVADYYKGDVQHLMNDTWAYLYQDAYNLASFSGRGLSQPATISAYCQQLGWDCSSADVHGLNSIQHFNADQANCGYLCSGQPIDSWAAFHPLGWGESHEIGHNLQYGHFKLYGGQSTEVSNNIFPLHKWLRYNRENPAASQYGRDMQQKATFELLQAGQLQAASETAAYVKGKLWFDDSLFWGRLLFYWQAALNSRDVAGIGDEGWDLFRLLYLQDRLFSAALKSDASWSAERSKLGFSHADYASRSAAQNMSSEDYLLIAMSFITRRDQRPYFDMWGIQYSSSASQQAAQYGYPAAAKQFWAVPCEAKAAKPPLPQALPVDGKTGWPLAADCPK